MITAIELQGIYLSRQPIPGVLTGNQKDNRVPLPSLGSIPSKPSVDIQGVEESALSLGGRLPCENHCFHAVGAVGCL